MISRVRGWVRGRLRVWVRSWVNCKVIGWEKWLMERLSDGLDRVKWDLVGNMVEGLVFG